MVNKPFKRLLAVDPSLASTGWVLFDLAKSKILSSGILSAFDAKMIFAKRLYFLQKDIDKLFDELKLGANDVLVCEGPAHLILNPQTALKVEHVRGIFETLARARSVEVPGRVNPRVIQSEILGLKGKQIERKEVKRVAREIALRLFGTQLEGQESKSKVISQDIIDAALIGAFCITQIDLCQKLNIDLVEAFQEKKRAFKHRF